MRQYDRQQFWEQEAETKGTPFVLGYIAASHESFLFRFKKEKRTVCLGFAVVFALMAYLHGIEAVANAIVGMAK